MLFIQCSLICVFFWSFIISQALAQTFSSGSDGSDGEINITEDTTLDVPSDGIFRATTITVAQSVTLRFNRNALNTPVYLLATGDINIAGTIDVSGMRGDTVLGGRGGPGGFDGGTPGIGELPPGPGQGPGAGLPASDTVREGSAAYGTEVGGGPRVATDGRSYGSSLLVPLVGGSGGGGSFTEGGGGGNAADLSDFL